MAKQTITLRLDEDDLTYLAEVDVPGASNLSEKIRGLLAEAKAQRAGLNDFGAAFDFSRRLFGKPERCVRDAEVREQVRSELIARVLAWLPETTAFVLAGAGTSDGREGLKRLEQGVGERALALTDAVLQLAAAGFPGCYSPKALSARAQSALNLATSSGENPNTRERS